MGSAPAHRPVFLSYASQDSEAARRLADGLSAAGVEVWLDQSELRGGDEWDARIRQQIKACWLFIPIISAASQARGEGYFRLEWKLAVDRSHQMASDRTFLLPVVVHDITERDARVPERFLDVQWTRLPGGTPTPAFLARTLKLLNAPDASTGRDSGVSTTEARRHPGTPERSRLPFRMVALVAAAIAAVIIGFFLVSRSPRSPPAASDKSIAVLPLANSTGDPSNEYISDGVSEELITSLSHLSHLKVIGRTSSFQFKGRSADSRSIGKKLAVRYLLEGSVHRAADRVRIAVALTSAADGASLWASTFESEVKDIFALQTKIADEVARQLKVTLLATDAGAMQASALAGAKENFDAYRALLQGNFYYQRTGAEGMQKAVDYYSEAVRLDPTYALAWAKLSITITHLVGNYTSTATREGKEMLARGRRAADTALSLDPLLADAHRARGLLLSHHDFDFAGAEAEFSRAVELEPQNSGSTAGLANLRGVFGRFEDGVKLTQKALSLDPLNTGFRVNLATLLISLRRYDAAEETLRQAIELQPQAAQHWQMLATIAILRARPSDAISLARKEVDPFWQTYALALAHQARGDRSEADAALKKLIAEDADDAGSQIASIYALRKEPDEMFRWLEHALETHDVGLMGLMGDPFLQAYKSDPRFTAFAKKLGAIPAP